MTSHEHPNVTIAREGFEAFERGDMGWMDEHMADDVIWHVGGNSKWAGTYQGKVTVLEMFGRQAQAMGLCKPGDPETLAKCFLWSVTGEALLKGLAGQAPPSTTAERDAHLEIAWRIFIDGIATKGSRST